MLEGKSWNPERGNPRYDAEDKEGNTFSREDFTFVVWTVRLVGETIYDGTLTVNKEIQQTY